MEARLAENEIDQEKSGKRKREANHILAERERRKTTTQHIVALSGIIPGLTKTDKVSVLGDTFKYVKQLQEKQKIVEEENAKLKAESMVAPKKSEVIVANSTEGVARVNVSLPEVVAKVSENKLLLRVYCEKQKGVLAKLFTEVENYDLIVVSSSIISFGSLNLDITIVAELGTGFDKNLDDFVRSLRATLLLASQ